MTKRKLIERALRKGSDDLAGIATRFATSESYVYRVRAELEGGMMSAPKIAQARKRTPEVETSQYVSASAYLIRTPSGDITECVDLEGALQGVTLNPSAALYRLVPTRLEAVVVDDEG